MVNKHGMQVQAAHGGDLREEDPAQGEGVPEQLVGAAALLARVGNMSEEQQQAANFFCKYCNTTLLGWLEADSHAEVCPSNSNSGLASGGTLPEQDGASSDEFEGIVDELELGEQAEVGQKSVNVSPSVNWTVLKGLLRSSAGSDNKAKKFKNKRRSRTEDGIMRLPCIHCDKTFSRKDNVAAHVKKVHSDLQDTLDESSGPGSKGGDEKLLPPSPKRARVSVITQATPDAAGGQSGVHGEQRGGGEEGERGA